MNLVGGVHARLSPDYSDQILIEIFDSQGINISKAKEKKIEGVYFKEDLRRVQISEIGNVVDRHEVLDAYSKGFENLLNSEAIRYSKSKVVIDYCYGVSGAILPQLLTKFGCDAVVLNASLKETSLGVEERESLLDQLVRVVEALQANVGVQVTANGEQLILVDEAGSAIRDERLTALMVNLMLTAHPRGTVVVPINASAAVEQIAHRHDGRVIRTKANPTALMEACQINYNVVIGGSGEMGFIFPKLHPGFDAMFCIAKVIEMLTIQERSLGQITADIPPVTHRCYTVRCPWKVKGALMRYLVETNPPEKLELIDGVKIINHQDDRWVLILPDAAKPLVHIYADSNDRDWVDKTLRDYRNMIHDFVNLFMTRNQLDSL